MSNRFELSTSRRLAIERLEARQYFDASGDHLFLIDPDNDQLSSEQAPATPTRPLVAFRIQLTDLQGNSLRQIHVSDEFQLNIYLQDLRELPPNSLHVFSAYTKLQLDNNHFEAIERGRLGRDFWDFNLRSDPMHPIISPTRELGGMVTSPYPNETGHLVYSLPVRAIAEGEGTIATLPPKQSDQSIPFETTLYGRHSELTSAEIYFESLQLMVHPEVSAPPITTTQPISLFTPELPITPSLNQSQDHAVNPPLAPTQLVTTQPLTTQPLTTQPAIVQPVNARPVNAQATDSMKESATQDLSRSESVNQLASMETVDQALQLPSSEIEIDGNSSSNQLGTDVHFASYNSAQTQVVDFVEDEFNLLIAQSSLSGNASRASSVEDFNLHWSLKSSTLPQISFEPLDKTFDERDPRTQQIARASLTDKRADKWFDQSKPLAKDVIDRVLQHFGPTSLDAQPNALAWETNYARGKLNRLPFQSPRYQSTRLLGTDGYADFALPTDSASVEVRSNEPLPILAKAESLASREVKISYPRTSLKLLDQESQFGQVSKHSPAPSIAAFKNPSETLTLEVAPNVVLFACEDSNSPEVSDKATWFWKSYLLVGLTSLLYAIRRSKVSSPDIATATTIGTRPGNK